MGACEPQAEVLYLEIGEYIVMLIVHTPWLEVANCQGVDGVSRPDAVTLMQPTQAVGRRIYPPMTA